MRRPKDKKVHRSWYVLGPLALFILVAGGIGWFWFWREFITVFLEHLAR